MRRYFLSIVLLAAIGAVAWSAPAMATSYHFTVDYSGGGVAALAPGSDNPLNTYLEIGDTFLYTLQALGNGDWSTISSGSVPHLFALYMYQPGWRKIDFTLNLLNDGSSVFTDSENDVVNERVTLGTNSVTLQKGLIFDTFSLYATIIDDDFSGNQAYSLLPYYPRNGGPEGNHPDILSFNANGVSTVPEPSTLVLLGAGLAWAGLLLVRERR